MTKIISRVLACILIIGIIGAALWKYLPPETWDFLSKPTETTDPAPTSTPEPTPELPLEPEPEPKDIPYDDTDSTKEPAARDGQMTHLYRSARSQEDLADYINREVYPHNYKVRAVMAAVMNDFIGTTTITPDTRVTFLETEVATATPEFKKNFATKNALWKQGEKTGEWVPEDKQYSLTQNVIWSNTLKKPDWVTGGMGIASSEQLCATKAADGNYYNDVIVALVEVETTQGTYRMIVVIKTLCGNQWYAKAIKFPYNPPPTSKPKPTPTPTPTPTPPPAETEQPKEIPVIVEKIPTGSKNYPRNAKFDFVVSWKYDGKRYEKSFSLYINGQQTIGYITYPKLFDKGSVEVYETIRSYGWSKNGYEVIVRSDKIVICVYNWYYDGGSGGDPTPTPTPTPNPPKGNLYDPPDGGGKPNNTGDPPQATQDPPEPNPIVPNIPPPAANNPGNGEGTATIPGGGTGETHTPATTPPAEAQNPSDGPPAGGSSNPETGDKGDKGDV